jgi:type IV pilus assembly protein PilO
VKKNQIVIVTVMALVVVTAAWWFLLLGPRKSAVAQAQKDLQSEQQKEQSLRTQKAHLEDLKKQEPKFDLRLAQIGTWLPDQPNEAQFIVDMTSIGKQSGIDFVSVAPAVPKAGSAGQGEIGLGIQIKGGFFQLLDYLVRVEKLPRSVVIDSISISPGVVDGQVVLTVALNARMFTSSVPLYTSLPPGATAPSAPGSTSTASPRPSPSSSPSPSQQAASPPSGASASAAPGRP